MIRISNAVEIAFFWDVTLCNFWKYVIYFEITSYLHV
jgi:hypothetical protein